MNRSAPVNAQDARVAIEPSRDGVQPVGVMPKAASIAALIVALALLGYAGLWAMTALQLRAGVLDWVAARQAEGYRVAYSRIGLGGFPTVARVTVKAPALAAPDGRALSWSWVGGKALLEVNPLRRDGFSLRLVGEELVSINVGGKLRTYRGGADELAFFAREAPGAGAGRLAIRNLAMASEEPGDLVEIDELGASAEAAGERALAGASVPAYAVAIEGAGIRLPRQLDLPLGELVSHVSARALVTGTVVPAGDLPGLLSRWRGSGGTAEVSHLGLRYGPLVLEGSGTASLDADMQPVGTFIARIQGFQQTLSALATRGIIDEQAAASASIALSILSRPGVDGGQPSVSLPLTVRERRLSVGPLPLMVVPLIEWPRGPSPSTGGLPLLAQPAAG